VAWNNRLNKGIWDTFPSVNSFGPPDDAIDPVLEATASARSMVGHKSTNPTNFHVTSIPSDYNFEDHADAGILDPIDHHSIQEDSLSFQHQQNDFQGYST
jgi:hypothetical protein